MKSGRFLCPSRNHVAAMGIALGVALLLSSSARAQNLVNNPGFNSPISTNAATTTNWVVTYVYGSRDDFAIADRTTWAKRTFGSADANGVAWGAQFRPITEGQMHAYFKQTVAGLTPGASYAVSGYMFRTWDRPDILDIYIETVGGLGSVRSANCSDMDAYSNRYAVTNTATAAGTIEVRLQYDKNKNTVDKHAYANACFDDISLTRP